MANDNNTNENNIDDIQKGVLHKKKFDIIVHDESPNSLTRDLGNKKHKSVNTKAYRKPVPRPRPVAQNNNAVPNNSQNAQLNAQPNTTSVNNATSNQTTPPQNLQYNMPQDFVETNTNYVEDEERKRQREKQLKETLDNYDKLLKEQEERRIANYNEFENAYNNVGKHETYLESRAKNVENVEEVRQGQQPQNVVEETYNNNNNVSNGQIGYEVDKNRVEYEVNNNNVNANLNTNTNVNTQQPEYQEVNKVEETKQPTVEENKVEQPTEQEENKEEVKEEESAYSLSAIQQKNMKRRKENIRLVVLLIILVTLAILCVVLFILRSRMIDEVPTGVTVQNQTKDVNREERIVFSNVTNTTSEGINNNTEVNTENTLTNSSLDELLNTENTTTENATTENSSVDNSSFNTHTAEGDSVNAERTLEEQLEATQTTLNELRSNQN